MNEAMKNMLTRRSCRKYQDKPVPQELLEQVLLAGSYAPSALNRQPGKVVVLRDPEEIKTIEDYSFRINEALKAFWLTCGVTLVDFKLEFGRLSDGTIVLADEISPDTSRLWDTETHEKLDKDRFRRDLGGVEEAYAEIMRRLDEHLK